MAIVAGRELARGEQRRDGRTPGGPRARPARPQQGERMAAEREPETAVVGHQILALGGHRQQRQRGIGGGRRERQRRLGAGHLPEGVVAVAGERGAGARGGERFEITAVERRGFGEALQVGERLRGARGDHPLRAGARQAAHEPQPEPQRRATVDP